MGSPGYPRQRCILGAGCTPSTPAPALLPPGRQLNDAHVKLGAEDGLAFASVNPTAALELLRWLQRSRPHGLHLYFDTFPRKGEPCCEAVGPSPLAAPQVACAPNEGPPSADTRPCMRAALPKLPKHSPQGAPAAL